jgi:hypothetical protein
MKSVWIRSCDTLELYIPPSRSFFFLRLLYVGVLRVLVLQYYKCFPAQNAVTAPNSQHVNNLHRHEYA